MYAISVDKHADSIRVLVQGNNRHNTKVTFPILSDIGDGDVRNGTKAATIKNYDIFDANISGAKPATFIVDRDGIIRWHEVGSKNHRVNFSTVIDVLEDLSEPPNTAPVIKGRISDLSVRSDERLVFDLSPHASDAEESPGSLRWEVEPTKTEYFTAEINGHQLTITPFPDEYGERSITLRLFDSAGDMDSQSLLVRVIPGPNVQKTIRLTVHDGLNLMHLPINVKTVNGAPGTITRISDLYEVLGGAANVHWLVTSSPGKPGGENELKPYFGGVNDSSIDAETGIFAALKAPRTLHLVGTLLNAPLHLNPGWNIVGIPHYDSGIFLLSDLAWINEIQGNASQIAVFEDGKFYANAPSDIIKSTQSDRRLETGQAILIEMTGAARITLPLK